MAEILGTSLGWGGLASLLGVVVFLVVVGEPRPVGSAGPGPWFAVGALVGVSAGALVGARRGSPRASRPRRHRGSPAVSVIEEIDIRPGVATTTKGSAAAQASGPAAPPLTDTRTRR